MGREEERFDPSFLDLSGGIMYPDHSNQPVALLFAGMVGGLQVCVTGMLSMQKKQQAKSI